MPTITVYVAGKGTALAEGGSSNAGHMWFTLNPGNGGAPESYGFAPVVHKDTGLPVVGEVKTNDNINYLSHEYAQTIEITQAQYETLKAFARAPEAYGFEKSNYWAPSNSCIDFVWKALQEAGLNHTGYEGSLWPTDNKEDLRKFVDLSPIQIQQLNNFLESSFPNTWNIPALSPTINTNFNNALNWVPPRRDPLVLDLDGGGITTSGINTGAPILFDQDGDGILTATGWIAPGEAIVVRDLNGNGTIDSGRELFGDNTILTHGPRAGQTAAHGFEALADLDSNLDGQFNSADAAFSGVKLWKDANQDGISQAAELFTFAELGVASINVSGTASQVNLGGGNTQTFAGSFTKTDGSNGNSGTAHLAGSLLLANNNFYREFTDDPALTAQALALPQMQGSGLVRDLRPAMSLGTAQATALQAALAQFAQGSTKAQQLADLDALVQSWGHTSAMLPTVVLGGLREESATKNVAGCARSTRATGRFGHRLCSIRSQVTNPLVNA